MAKIWKIVAAGVLAAEEAQQRRALLRSRARSSTSTHSPLPS
jgi:hypothetical protein